MHILRQDPICFGCAKFLNDNSEDILKDDEVRELKTCTKCKTVQYCSRDCLQKNWTEKNGHKQVCNFLTKLLKEIEEIKTLHEGIETLKPITSALFESVKRFCECRRKVAISERFWHQKFLY